MKRGAGGGTDDTAYLAHWKAIVTVVSRPQEGYKSELTTLGTVAQGGKV